nr:ATP-binding protein [uncultured Arsenicibacter sp.]
MKIKNRIALQFSIIVASILFFFSLIVYLTSSTYRREEFYERLKKKARTTVRFLVEVQEVDTKLLKIIDRNTMTALIAEKVLIFNERNQLIYSSVDDQVIRFKPSLLEQVRQEGEIETFSDENELVGILYTDNGQKLVVLASAVDQFGRSKLRNLRKTLAWGLVIGIGLTVGLGIFFAGQSLHPISVINQQVQTITANNLRQRLPEGNQRDEIDQLAMNFNVVLDRLEQAFEQQRSFVSHASHELRTPLAALKSEIQLGLRKPLNPDEHELMMRNLMEDTERLINITNSLLFLARIQNNLEPSALTTVRLEELIFDARDELLNIHPDYQIHIDFQNMPDSEDETSVKGKPDLLRRVLLNLMDNACKYSADHTTRVSISTNATNCQVAIQDKGIGIPPEELGTIFSPFTRASNSLGYDGFGMGLSICRRIVELHHGKLTVSSRLNHGSTFFMSIPHLQSAT